jgi:hypothetical protein
MNTNVNIWHFYLGFSGFVQGMATKSNGRQLILSGPQHVVFVVVVVVTRPDGTVNFWSMTMLRLFLLLLLVPTSGTGSRSLLTQPPPEKIQDNSFVELVWWQWWPTATTSVPIESQLQIEKQWWNVDNKSMTGRDYYSIYISFFLSILSIGGNREERVHTTSSEPFPWLKYPRLPLSFPYCTQHMWCG